MTRARTIIIALLVLGVIGVALAVVDLGALTFSEMALCGGCGCACAY